MRMLHFTIWRIPYRPGGSNLLPRIDSGQITGRLSGVLLAVVIGACGDGDRETRMGRSGEAFWETQEVGRIGSVDDPEEALAAVAMVLIGPAKQLYVQEVARVFAYDSTGALQTIIGRRGEGPGEFAGLGSIGIKGDTLYAADHWLGRVSYFSLAGDYRSSLPWASAPEESAIPGVVQQSSAPDILLPDGTALLKRRYHLHAPQRVLEPGVFHWTTPQLYERVDQHGAVINTVARFDVHPTTVRLGRGIYSYAMAHVFESTALSTLMADGSGVVIVEREPTPDRRESTFQVSLIGPASDTIFSRPIAYSPVPLTPRHVQWLIEQKSSLRPPQVEIPSVAERERALRAAGLVPRTHVPVYALESGQDGSIWLQLSFLPDDDAAIWMVLDGQGKVEGHVRLPAQQRVVAAMGDVLVTLEMHEWDVPQLVRHRIVR